MRVVRGPLPGLLVLAAAAREDRLDACGDEGDGAGPASARVLGKRPGAVRTAAHRGLKRLAGHLTRAGARGATPGAQRMLKDGT